MTLDCQVPRGMLVREEIVERKEILVPEDHRAYKGPEESRGQKGPEGSQGHKEPKGSRGHKGPEEYRGHKEPEGSRGQRVLMACMELDRRAALDRRATLERRATLDRREVLESQGQQDKRGRKETVELHDLALPVLQVPVLPPSPVVCLACHPSHELTVVADITAVGLAL